MINKLLKIIIIFLSIILFKDSSFATFAILLFSGTSSIVYTKYTDYNIIFGFILTIILNFYFIFSLIRNLFKKNQITDLLFITLVFLITFNFPYLALGYLEGKYKNDINMFIILYYLFYILYVIFREKARKDNISSNGKN